MEEGREETLETRKLRRKRVRRERRKENKTTTTTRDQFNRNTFAKCLIHLHKTF